MKPLPGLAPGAAAGVALILALFGPLAAAGPEIALPTATPAERSAAPATSAAPSLPKQLAQALVQRNRQAGQPGGASPSPDKQRLLDWLVDLQRDEVKRLKELLAFTSTPASPADEEPLLKTLQGPPPYSALQLDALRDEIDGRLAAAGISIPFPQRELRLAQPLPQHLFVRTAEPEPVHAP